MSMQEDIQRVLAVLDAKINHEHNPFEHDNQTRYYLDLIDARATVAALPERLAASGHDAVLNKSL